MRNLLLLLAFAALPLRAQAPPADLAPLQFLLGSWEAEPQPGGGTGRCAFTSELQGRVIVRTNHADYPAAGGRPAISHDDLMVIHAEASQLQADYYDNEGHTIRYTISAHPDGSLEFLSAATPGMPRYRLTYAKAPQDRISGQFEVAPPDKPAQFATYLQWFLRRPAAPTPPPK
jgi:hypothetical protein